MTVCSARYDWLRQNKLIYADKKGVAITTPATEMRMRIFENRFLSATVQEEIYKNIWIYGYLPMQEKTKIEAFSFQ